MTPAQKKIIRSPTIAVIDKMDEILTDGQKLAIMETEGCCKSGKLAIIILVLSQLTVGLWLR